MFDRLADLVSEHAELEHALADPAVHSDQDKARTLGRRYAELTPIVHAYQEWQQTSRRTRRPRASWAGRTPLSRKRLPSSPPAASSSRPSCKSRAHGAARRRGSPV